MNRRPGGHGRGPAIGGPSRWLGWDGARWRLLSWLTGRLCFTWAVVGLLISLLAWIVAQAEGDGFGSLSLSHALSFMLGLTLLAAPLTLYLAVCWLCLAVVHAGTLELWLCSGVPWARWRHVWALLLGVALLATSVAAEVCLPVTRDAIVPVAFREWHMNRPVVLGRSGAWTAVRLGRRLSHIKEAWVRRDGVVRYYRELHHSGGDWRQVDTGIVVAGLPTANAMLAARPSLLEFMSIREIWALAEPDQILTSYLGLVIWERLLRPWFWWLWLLALPAVLLTRRWGYGLLTGVAILWLLLGVALLVMHREVAWSITPAWLRWLIMAAPTCLAGLGLTLGSQRWVVHARALPAP